MDKYRLLVFCLIGISSVISFCSGFLLVNCVEALYHDVSVHDAMFVESWKESSIP